MGTLGKSKQIQVNPTKRDRRRNGRKKAHTAQKGGRDWVEGWCSRVGTLGKSDQIQANPTKSELFVVRFVGFGGVLASFLARRQHLS